LGIKTNKLDDSYVYFAVGEAETQKPIAIALLCLKNGQIGGLLVDSEYRKQGYGTRIMEEIEKYAKEAGLKHLQLVTHPSNIATREFCKKLGYNEWIKLLKQLGK